MKKKKTTFRPRDFGVLVRAIPTLHGPDCACSLCLSKVSEQEKERRLKLKENDRAHGPHEGDEGDTTDNQTT